MDQTSHKVVNMAQHLCNLIFLWCAIHTKSFPFFLLMFPKLWVYLPAGVHSAFGCQLRQRHDSLNILCSRNIRNTNRDFVTSGPARLRCFTVSPNLLLCSPQVPQLSSKKSQLTMNALPNNIIRRVCVCDLCFGEGVGARPWDMLLWRVWGDSRMLKNWWVVRGHVSPKTFPAVIHVLRDDFLSSISLHPAEASWQRYPVGIRAALCRAKNPACASLREGGPCACEGQGRIFGEDRTVNYSRQKVPLVAHNPIAKAWFASLLDCAAFNGINSESVSRFVVWKRSPWTRSAILISGKQNRNMWDTWTL